MKWPKEWISEIETWASGLCHIDAERCLDYLHRIGALKDSPIKREYWITIHRGILKTPLVKLGGQIDEYVEELYEPRVFLQKPSDPHNWVHVKEVAEEDETGS